MVILRARKLEEICQHPIFCGVFGGGGPPSKWGITDVETSAKGEFSEGQGLHQFCW